MKADVDRGVAGRKPKAAAQTTADQRVWREVVSWFWVIVAFIFIEGTLVQARVIPSGSMENTVLIGDHIIVSRIGYDAGIPFTDVHEPLWRSPKRQQIVVFRAPLPDEGNPDFIKRCIGLPGDHIKMVGERVYVNGQLLNEPYALKSSPDSPFAQYPPAEDPTQDTRLTSTWASGISQYVKNGELVVPPGEYFMMGDNRDNSFDSRYWGFVPRRDVIGVPLFIYMSIRAPEQVWDPGHIGERFETYLKVFVDPGEVRWRRLFRTFPR
ncbi:MAG: signal peptidase I [Acidobacteriota bacterium]|nr:signal peptidase I [Acidobacteriota bacterium]MDE3169379.1 signal peptidase I [Acidobacteriota bacterium]